MTIKLNVNAGYCPSALFSDIPEVGAIYECQHGKKWNVFKGMPCIYTDEPMFSVSEDLPPCGAISARVANNAERQNHWPDLEPRKCPKNEPENTSSVPNTR